MTAFWKSRVPERILIFVAMQIAIRNSFADSTGALVWIILSLSIAFSLFAESFNTRFERAAKTFLLMSCVIYGTAALIITYPLIASCLLNSH